VRAVSLVAPGAAQIHGGRRLEHLTVALDFEILLSISD
jgi:hypothetical protein